MKNMNNICVITTYHDINHFTEISLIIKNIIIWLFNSVSLPFNGRLTELMFDKKTFIIIVHKTWTVCWPSILALVMVAYCAGDCRILHWWRSHLHWWRSNLALATVESCTGYGRILHWWRSHLALVKIESCTCDDRILHWWRSNLALVTVASCIGEDRILHWWRSNLALVTVESCTGDDRILHW